MVNSSHFAFAAVATLLLFTGCARNDVSRDAVTEQPAEKNTDNFWVFGRRTGEEPCSVSQYARHSC
jgi:hypothetical protein